MSSETTYPKLKEGITFAPFDSSTLELTYLAELPDDRRLQISNMLYQFLLLCDGKRSVSEIAQTLSLDFERKIDVAQVEEFIERRLEPQGLLQRAENDPLAAERRAPARKSVLQLLVKIPLLSVRQLNAITAVTRHLYSRPMAILMLILILPVHFLVYRQLSQVVPSFNLRDLNTMVYGPLFALVIFGSLWHEFGHLSACRRFNCEHGSLGFGLYMMWPVFYVDVSAAWLLPRWQRVIVDLGGIYFTMVLAVVLYVVSLFSHQETLLFPVIIALDMGTIYNLNPIFKFDGYWLLSDMIGVPNLHRRIGKYLKEMLPWPRKQKASSLLSTQPYAKITASLYALLSTIYFIYFFWAMIWFGPKFIREYPMAIMFLYQQARDRLLASDALGILESLIIIFFNSIMLLAFSLMLVRLLTSVFKVLLPVVLSLKARLKHKGKVPT